MVALTKYFVVRIISKFCGWTNQNFVDSTKSFSEYTLWSQNFIGRANNCIPPTHLNSNDNIVLKLSKLIKNILSQISAWFLVSILKFFFKMSKARYCYYCTKSWWNITICSADYFWRHKVLHALKQKWYIKFSN